jgi:hypothetical protein
VILSQGYEKSQLLQVKLFGKLDHGGIYENIKTASLTSNGFERVTFDVKDIYF